MESFCNKVTLPPLGNQVNASDSLPLSRGSIPSLGYIGEHSLIRNTTTVLDRHISKKLGEFGGQ